MYVQTKYTVYGSMEDTQDSNVSYSSCGDDLVEVVVMVMKVVLWEKRSRTRVGRSCLEGSGQGYCSVTFSGVGLKLFNEIFQVGSFVIGWFRSWCRKERGPGCFWRFPSNRRLQWVCSGRSSDWKLMSDSFPEFGQKLLNWYGAAIH